MQRRDFNLLLQRSALALALTPWTQAMAEPVAQRISWRTQPFALGVASGRPRSDSLVLWTRLLLRADDAHLANKALPVELEVFADAALKQRVQVHTITTNAVRGHSVHAQLKNLKPATDYWYRFRCGDAFSAVGHARTAPALNADVQQLRLALTSCQNFEHGLYVAHQEIAKEPLDFVLFMGDYIYESNNPQTLPRKHNNEEPKPWRNTARAMSSTRPIRCCKPATPRTHGC